MKLRSLILGTAAILGALPAFAQEIMRIRPEVTISGDTIRLDQLIENIGKVGDIAVFRAPAPGMRGTIRAERIIAAARELGVFAVEAGDLASVMINRPGRTISRSEMQDAVARLANERGVSSNLDILLDDHHAARMIDAKRADALKVSGFSRDARSGRFEARLAIPGELESGDSWIVTGSIVETREVAVPTSDIERGETIQGKDLTFIKRPAGQIPADLVRTSAELVGMVTRKTLRAGEMIRTADIVKPILVEKNAVVTVSYQGKGITLSMRGRAQTSGTMGDSVKIMNLQSKKIIDATVSGLGMVTVTTPMPQQAAIAPALSQR